LDGLKKLEMLTKREGEIAELLLKGMTYKMIAKELFLSENTIKTHIKNIYAKLKVQNKSELLIYLMSNENTEE
jgi:DNA-binding NarL/FixJ family response regulator